MLDHTPPHPATAEPLAPRERPAAIIRVVLGLTFLLALAYLSGHPRVQRFEQQLGLSQMITAGFPFVLLGLLARLPSVGVLTDDVLSQLSPVLRLGLGWIGFMVGFRFDGRLLEGLPPRALTIAALFTLVPFAMVLGTTAAALGLLHRLPTNLSDPVFVRDAIILGTAGAMTAHSAVGLLYPGPDSQDSGLLARILRLEELAGILGLAVIAAYFRPQPSGASWQLPGTGWLFLTLGLGMAAGLLMHLLLRSVSGPHELVAVGVGSILFAAGLAGAVQLSPVVVCFVMGLLVTNSHGRYRADLGNLLLRLERPLYFLFLMIVGALWTVGDWRGWGLMLVFVISRLAGKFFTARLTRLRYRDAMPDRERRILAIAPLGPLSLAIVVNAQLLYPGGSVSLIVTAIVGGAIVTEVLVQLSRRWWAVTSGGDVRPS